MIFLFYFIIFFSNNLYANEISKYVEVKNVPLNVRNGPDIKYPIILKIKRKGLIVKLMHQIDNYCMIRLNDNSEGWTICAGLKNSTKIVEIGTNINIYRIPREQIILTTKKAIFVSIIQKGSEWSRIQIDKNTTGWIENKYINL